MNQDNLQLTKDELGQTKTERHTDRKAEKQKYKKTIKRYEDRQTKIQKDNKKDPEGFQGSSNEPS